MTSDRLRDSLASIGQFSEMHELRRGAIRVQFSPEGPAEARTEAGGPLGIRAVTDDGLYVVQFRKDGFTFSRLPPYTNWNDFVGYARTCAATYLDLVRPTLSRTPGPSLHRALPTAVSV